MGQSNFIFDGKMVGKESAFENVINEELMETEFISGFSGYMNSENGKLIAISMKKSKISDAAKLYSNNKIESLT